MCCVAAGRYARRNKLRMMSLQMRASRLRAQCQIARLAEFAYAGRLGHDESLPKRAKAQR